MVAIFRVTVTASLGPARGAHDLTELDAFPVCAKAGAESGCSTGRSLVTGKNLPDAAVDKTSSCLSDTW